MTSARFLASGSLAGAPGNWRRARGARLGLEPRRALAFAMQSAGMRCSGRLILNQCQASAILRPDVQCTGLQSEAKRCNESRGTNAMQRNGSEQDAMQPRWTSNATKGNAMQHHCEKATWKQCVLHGNDRDESPYPVTNFFDHSVTLRARRSKVPEPPRLRATLQSMRGCLRCGSHSAS